MEEKKRGIVKHENINWKMLGKEVQHSIHRATSYGPCYIRHEMPTLNVMEFVRLTH